MEHQKEARQNQGKGKAQKVTSDLMKEWLMLSEVQAAVNKCQNKNLKD